LSHLDRGVNCDFVFRHTPQFVKRSFLNEIEWLGVKAKNPIV
jgi:hypothetical protein